MILVGNGSTGICFGLLGCLQLFDLVRVFDCWFCVMFAVELDQLLGGLLFWF